MESSPDDSLRIGLPDELAAILGAELDDWDDWQIEGMMAEALFVLDERRPAEDAAGPAASAELMGATLAFMAAESEWGIDEPLTAADFSFMDEDDF